MHRRNHSIKSLETNLELNKEIQLVSKGKELFQKNILKHAQSAFEEVIEINPKNIDAYFYTFR